jgi:hypothetical protein
MFVRCTANNNNQQRQQILREREAAAAVLAREQLIREREQVMREREREARWQADFMAERMHVIHAQQRSAVLHQVCMLQ